MKIQYQPYPNTSVFTAEECEALRSVRDRVVYGEIFGPRELAQLQFLRWLHQTGRLVSPRPRNT